MGFTYKAITDHIRGLTPDSQQFAAIEAVVSGMTLPFVPNAPVPKMQDLTEAAHDREKLNPLYFVELRDNYVRFNLQWMNYYGSQWPAFKDNVKLVHAMAKEHGIDLATFAPETVSLFQIKNVDEIFGMADDTLAELEKRIKRSNEIGLEQLADAKKKRWAKTLARVSRMQGWCREAIPRHVRGKKATDEEREVWESLHTLRYMLYTMRSKLIDEHDELSLLLVPPHLVKVCQVISITRKFQKKLRIDGVMISLPPGHFKPLDVETVVLMADGTYRELGRIMVGNYVITHRGHAREVTGVHKQGELPVVKIKTRHGRIVRSALDHPFKTVNGWVDAGKLRAGMVLACIPAVGAEPPDDWASIDDFSDEVVSVEPAGTAECRCLTVDEDKTFLAWGLVVHNSWMAIGDRALQLNLRPGVPAAFLHYVQDTAKERFDAVRDHFDGISTISHRRRALFPDITLDKRNRSKQKMWLCKNGIRQCEEYQESVLSAYGVHTSAQGKGLIELTIDDPSDEKEATQAGTREDTNRAMARTWMNRLRGINSFFVMIYTVWHSDDFSQRLLKSTRTGDMRIGYYQQAVGGPENGFKPICPEVYDARRLKAQFIQMGPADYSLIFQGNPLSDAIRRIAKMHFYDYDFWRDPKTRDEAWTKFFTSPATEYWISCDPSGTGKKGANLAGFMLSAFGTLRRKQFDGTWADEPKLVFLEFSSLHASQIRLASAISEVVKVLQSDPDRHPLYRLIIESTGGYHATAEHMEEQHGFDPEIIIRKPPGQGDKVFKLFKYGGIHIENADVLFPGVWMTDEKRNDERVLTMHPQWEAVATQLLQAGSVKEDNLLDCVRQQCQEVSERIFRMREDIADLQRGPKKVNVLRSRKMAMYRSLIRKSKPEPKSHLPKMGRFMNRIAS